MAGVTGSSLITINMVLRMAVRVFKNTNKFLKSINTQYDGSFAIDGAKIGDSIRIRLPNDYTVRVGAAASVQNTTEQYTTLPLQTQLGVDTGFSTAERTLKLDDYAERVVLPKMNKLAGAIAADLMSITETGYTTIYAASQDNPVGGGSPLGGGGGVCNMVANFQNGQGTTLLSPTQFTWLAAGALLDDNSSPELRRKAINDPTSDARIAGLLAGLFNPVTEISGQYRSGAMKNALGFDWVRDQTVLKHTVGSFTAGTVNGAGQGGSPGGTNLTVNAITGTLNAGDIITIVGVNAVNRVTSLSTGALRQFVVTANVATGATVIPIYPGIVAPAIVNGVATPVQYQTVTPATVNTVCPANGAVINLMTLPNITYRKNIAFAPEFMTMATADLVLPPNLQEGSRANYDGVSMRALTQYQAGTDVLISRLDVIYGAVVPRGEWAVIVPDITP
jgi:hypothetical protein